MKLTIILTKVICLLFLFVSTLNGQTRLSKIDYSGYITKYDTLFNGIGPQVYFLPPGRTKEDDINDMRAEFKKVLAFEDTIKNEILFHDLVTSYNKTNNTEYINSLIQSNTVTLNNYPKFVKEQEQNKNYGEAIGLLNEIARKYILQKETNKAESILLEGISLASRNKRLSDKNILQSNLVAVYLYNKKFAKAKTIVETQYRETKKGKSLTEEGKSLVDLAVVQAFNNDYNTAENTIIRKAIPIFNRTKDYDNKINAWIKLAQIYTLNKRYPEAQWFLIQAQELAALRNINKYNTTIEYMLGYAKFYQDNLLVSKKELTAALNLAKEEGNKHIELSATQILADINIKLKNAEEAEYFLKSYWHLRKELF